MCGYAAWGLAFAALSAGTTMYASYQRAETREAVAQYNARMQEIRAERIQRKGVAAENVRRAEMHETISMQKVQTAAGGVRVGSGGALQLQRGVRLVSNAEALQIRENYNRRASTVQRQASLISARGQAASSQIMMSGFGNALGAAASGFSTGYSTARKLDTSGGYGALQSGSTG